MTIFYCINFGDSPNLEGHVPVFISPRNRIAQERALVPIAQEAKWDPEPI
jgi:hypothetical protein